MNPGMMNFLASRTMPIAPPVPPMESPIMPGLRAGLNRGTASDAFRGAPNAKQAPQRDVIGKRYPQGADDFGGVYGQGGMMQSPQGPALPPIQMYQ